jgi:hypothetical protein
MSPLWNLFGMVDRFLFGAACWLTIIFVALSFFEYTYWPWYWDISPLWLYFIITFIPARMKTKAIMKDFEKPKEGA